jgi:hypothetical protein
MTHIFLTWRLHVCDLENIIKQSKVKTNIKLTFTISFLFIDDNGIFDEKKDYYVLMLTNGKNGHFLYEL